MVNYKCIMIVEDHEDLQLLYKRTIQRMGYVVFTADHGEEALQKLAILDEKHKPCLVLTDLMMPVMGGWELVQKMTDQCALASIPVVVMSAAETTGGKGGKVLKKPVSASVLMALIEQYCGPAPGIAPVEVYP